jgi:hypothetical protein
MYSTTHDSLISDNLTPAGLTPVDEAISIVVRPTKFSQ